MRGIGKSLASALASLSDVLRRCLGAPQPLCWTPGGNLASIHLASDDSDSVCVLLGGITLEALRVVQTIMASFELSVMLGFVFLNELLS